MGVIKYIILVTLLSEVIIWGIKKWAVLTDNPKNTSIKFKADDETVRKLKECSEILNVSRAEVLRQGVHRMYDDLKK